MNNQEMIHTEYLPLLRTLVELIRRPSPSGQEDLVRSYVVDRLQQAGFRIRVDDFGNILAVRGQPAEGAGYPLLSFHLDSVTVDAWQRYSSCSPVTRKALETSAAAEDSQARGTQTPFSSNPPASRAQKRDQRRQEKQKRKNRDLQRRESQVVPFMRVPDVTPREVDNTTLLPPWVIKVEGDRLHCGRVRIPGGDDKCGGAIALTLADATTMPLKIVASVQEEVGCLGIEAVSPTFFADVSYALVLDRRGAHDLIVSIGALPLCHVEFRDAMLAAAASVGLHVTPTEGMMSDALRIAHYCNTVNVSVGYYLPHTVDEYISISDFASSYRWIKEALSTLACPPSGNPAIAAVLHDAEALPYDASIEDVEPDLCPFCGNFMIPVDELDEDLLSMACFCQVDFNTIPGWILRRWGYLPGEPTPTPRGSSTDQPPLL